MNKPHDSTNEVISNGEALLQRLREEKSQATSSQAPESYDKYTDSGGYEKHYDDFDKAR